MARSVKVCAWSFIFMCLVTTPASSQQTVTREENAIRRMYAKLRYAVKIGEIHETIQHDAKASTAELEYRLEKKKEMTISLANFLRVR